MDSTGGQIVNDRAPKRRDIAMVFQNYALYPHMTVRHSMGFALKPAKMPREEIERRVNEAARSSSSTWTESRPTSRAGNASEWRSRAGPRDRGLATGGVRGRPAGPGPFAGTRSRPIDVLESMGSEFYAHFTLATEKVSSRELEELAHHSGAAEVPAQDGNQVVARLEAASSVRQDHEAELWVNTDHLHLFDAETGRSLLGAGAADDRDAPADRAQPVLDPATT